MEPQTGLTHCETTRLHFRRRERMSHLNLILIYFDGSIGDLHCKGGSQSQNSFRLRHGALLGLSRLMQKNQVAIVLPYAKKRSKIISCYLSMQKAPQTVRSSLSQVQLPLCDAIYCVRKRKLMSGDLRFINYSQIYADFSLSENDDDLMKKCLIVACRTQELLQKS